tara:strand:- start:3031 stop:3450 length:420 start_codon:yes stop_codon:yes gene_type:complete
MIIVFVIVKTLIMKHTFYQDQIISFNHVLYSDPFHLKILNRTKRYLDVNFYNTIELKDLALSQGFSRYQLLRLFKFYYGITPKQYQINKRIEEAKNKLKNGCRVSESCYDVGFHSITTFSTLFKRKTGFTPSEFKKSNF